MLKKLKAIKFLLLGTVVLILAVAYLVLPNEKVNNNDNTLNIATMGEPATLDFQYSSGTWERDIINDLFSGLFIKSAEGETIPDLAKSWDVSNGGKTYTFHLRDAKWSDGTPITAHDFVYSYKRMLNPESATTYAQLLYVIKGASDYNTGRADEKVLAVKALDDKTFQVELEYPAGYFTDMLSHYAFYPVPKHVVEKFGKDWSKQEHSVTSGAYKLVEWKPNAYIKATRNELFWDNDNTHISNIVYHTQEDRAAVLKRFRSGEIHIARDFSSDQYEWLIANMLNETIVYPYMGIYYFAVNTKNDSNKALDNKKIRNALAMSIDREFIVDKVLKSGEVAAYSFVPKGLAGYTPSEVSWKDLSKEARIEEARNILAEAGYNEKNPLKVEISYNTSENHKKVVVAIASMFKEINVIATAVNSEVAVHYKNMQNREFEIGRSGWIADYDEPSSFLFVGETGVGNNYAHYSSQKFDEYMKEARSSTSLRDRNRFYNRAESLLLEDMPYIPIYYYVSRNLVAKKVKGFIPNTSDEHLSRYLRLDQE